MNAHPVYASYIPQLKTNRGMVKLVLLNLITLGIYGVVVLTSIGKDVNTVASKYDGKKTMHYCLLVFLIAPLTLGIGAMVWYHRISARIGNELLRRGLAYRFGAGAFWGWNILGVLFLAGPFIYLHKLCKAMNLLCDDYNARG